MLKSIFADLLAGFIALGVVMAGFVAGVIGQNLRTQVFAVSALFLLAGMRKGAAASLRPWLRGAVIALGAGAPVCLMAGMGAAFTSRAHLIVFLSTSLLAAIVGVYVRQLWQLEHRGASLILAITWTVAVMLAAQLLLPAMLAKQFGRYVQRVAPPFEFAALDGARTTREMLRGRVAVLTFWASWCAPCREELPRLDALYQRYRENPRVAFLAVNTEREGNSEASAAKAEAFFRKTGLSLPLVLGDANTSRSLGVSGLPTLVILDPTSDIRFVHTGYDGAENLERLIEEQVTALLRSAP